MDLAGIPQARLRNQRILADGFSKPAEVVAWLGAVQAQDFAGAKWALALRMTSAVDHDVEQAFASGAILRTHVLRPTWHFVTPADIRWLLALTGPRVQQLNAGMYRKLGMDADLLKRGDAVLAAALHRGGHLTREALRDVLHQAGLETVGELRLSYWLMHAELEGLICSGPRAGKQFTYALVDERAPAAQALTLTKDEALAELAQRFFQSHGPATAQDFARWSGLTLGAARRGLDAINTQLRSTTIGGQTYWFGEPAALRKRPVAAHLLSIYDEYISGHKDRSAMITAEHARRLGALGNALTHIVVLDGHIVGTWKRTIKTGVVEIDLTIFQSLQVAQRAAIESAAHAFARYLGLSAAIAWLV